MDSNPTVCRDVPSLRWLRMVTLRYSATRDIVANLAQHGHTFPDTAGVVQAIRKLWFMLDLPRSGGRIAVMHAQTYWSDKDICLANFFIVKLDMRLTDPVEGSGQTQLRDLMFGQRNFWVLRNLLFGRLSKIEVLKIWVRYEYNASVPLRDLPILGVPANEIGRGNLEAWGTGTTRLIRPDELIVREGIRRSMGLHLKYLDMIRWGYLAEAKKRKKDMVRLGQREPFGGKWVEKEVVEAEKEGVADEKEGVAQEGPRPMHQGVVVKFGIQGVEMADTDEEDDEDEDEGPQRNEDELGGEHEEVENEDEGMVSN